MLSHTIVRAIFVYALRLESKRHKIRDILKLKGKRFDALLDEKAIAHRIRTLLRSYLKVIDYIYIYIYFIYEGIYAEVSFH